MGYATVSLTLVGERLDPEAVTAIMGLSPTSSHLAHDSSAIRKHGDRAGRLGQWHLSRNALRVEDIESVVREFADAYLKTRSSLVGIERCQLSIGLMKCRSVGDSFVLSPGLLRLLANADCLLFVDAYGQEETGTATG
jgi:hypothetical protein